MEIQILHDCDFYQLTIGFLSLSFVLGQPGVTDVSHTSHLVGVVCGVSACLMLPHHLCHQTTLFIIEKTPDQTKWIVIGPIAYVAWTVLKKMV